MQNQHDENKPSVLKIITINSNAKLSEVEHIKDLEILDPDKILITVLFLGKRNRCKNLGPTRMHTKDLKRLQRRIS